MGPLLHSLIVVLKKLILEKTNQQTTPKYEKLPSMQIVNSKNEIPR